MSTHESPIDERDLRDIAALADGSLRGRRREAMERRVRSHPELAALLVEQESVVRAIRAVDAGAPASLRAAVARSSSPPTVRRSRAPMFGLGLAGAVAAVVAVIVLALPSGTPGAPSVVEAAALGVRPATEAAPAPSPIRPGLLQRSFGGVDYPDWGPGFGWHATGVRVDTAGGRKVTTVFYADRHGRRIAYGIVDGKPLRVPDGATTVRAGTRFRSLARGSRIVVTWRQGGHTCVLSGPQMPASVLVRLAAAEYGSSHVAY